MTAICCNVESSINEDDYELNRLHHPVTTTTVTLKVRKITVVTENQRKLENLGTNSHQKANFNSRVGVECSAAWISIDEDVYCLSMAMK